MSKLNSRKFYLAVGSLVMLNIALYTDKIYGEQYISGVSIILGLYFGANVVQRLKGNDSE